MIVVCVVVVPEVEVVKVNVDEILVKVLVVLVR